MTLSKILAVAALSLTAFGALAEAQDVPRIAIYNGRTYIAAKITLNIDIDPIKASTFAVAPATNPHEREFIARGVIENGQEDRMWAAREYKFSEALKYPVVGIGKFGGQNNTIIAASVTMSAALKPNEQTVSDGYRLQATRAIKSGDVVPAIILYADNSKAVISIEAAGSDQKNPQPLLTIFPQDLNSGTRAKMIAAWREANASVHGLPPIVSLP